MRVARVMAPRTIRPDEAARVDGAKVRQVLWHLTLPLAKPALRSATLLVFILTQRFVFSGLTAGAING
jgi:ABC-type glycerol-3-phosphate transport system permease component